MLPAYNEGDILAAAQGGEVSKSLMPDNVELVDPSDGGEAGNAENVITFQYDKSPLFREIYATGAYGAVTPNVGIRICFYSQHVPDPSLHVFSLNENGTLAKLLKAEPAGEGVIVRAVEIGVTLDLSTAVALVKWLEGQITQVHNQMGIEAPGTPEEASKAQNAESI